MKIELKGIKFFTLTILLLSCTITTFSQINKVKELKIANKSAVYWLSNLDASEFDLCWNGLSSEVQRHFDKNDWIIGMTNEMGNVGNLISREETYREFTSEIEGLPDGYYAIFEYISEYENTEAHTESILLHQDDKRRWKILAFQYDYKGGRDVPEEE